MTPAIDNETEFYPHHYLAEVLDSDLAGIRSKWSEAGAGSPPQRLAATKWHNAHDFAQSTGGLFQSMEEMDCSALMAFVQDFFEQSPHRQMQRLLQIGSDCFTKFSTIAASLIARVEEEKAIKPERYSACFPLAREVLH